MVCVWFGWLARGWRWCVSEMYDALAALTLSACLGRAIFFSFLGARGFLDCVSMCERKHSPSMQRLGFPVLTRT